MPPGMVKIRTIQLIIIVVGTTSQFLPFPNCTLHIANNHVNTVFGWMLDSLMASNDEYSMHDM